MATVDILIPAYTRSGALAATLTALMPQTFKNFRVVISDQTEGSKSRTPSRKMNAGTQAFGTFQRNANGLLQVTTFKKLQAAKDAAAIENFRQTQIFYRRKLAAHGLRRRLR